MAIEKESEELLVVRMVGHKREGAGKVGWGRRRRREAWRYTPDFQMLGVWCARELGGEQCLAPLSDNPNWVNDIIAPGKLQFRHTGWVETVSPG